MYLSILVIRLSKNRIHSKLESIKKIEDWIYQAIFKKKRRMKESDLDWRKMYLQKFGENEQWTGSQRNKKNRMILNGLEFDVN